MKPRPPRLQSLFILCLLAVSCLTSGCVYLRLLQLKNQLADFEKNFAYSSADGLRLIFKSPVLLGDDLRWLGAEPESIHKTDNNESWQIRWAKELPPGTKEEGVYDVVVNAEMTDHRLRSVQIPERYFAYVSKSLFVSALRSAGHAHIDRQSRQAVMNTPPDEPGAVGPVDRPSIQKMLGLPTQLINEPQACRYRYVFRPQTSGAPGKPVEVTFVFDPTSGMLRKLIGKLPKGTLSFDFSGTESAKDAQPHPAASSRD